MNKVHTLIPYLAKAFILLGARTNILYAVMRATCSTHQITLDLIPPVGTYFKMRALWEKAPCSLVEVDRRFRGTYWICLQGNAFYRPYDGVIISETSIYFNETTRRYIPEGFFILPAMRT
jgi:hypothetical protein